MSFRSYRLLACLIVAMASGLAASTPTYTGTATPTFSSTITASSTATRTSVPGTFTDTSTKTVTVSPTLTPSSTTTPTVTQTSVPGTPTDTSTATVSPTMTLTSTLTPPPTPTPGGSPVPNPVLDDFEDGDLIGANGGHWLTSTGGSSSMNVTLAAGSTLTLSTGAAHCTGNKGASMTTDYAELILQIFPGGTWAYLPPACPSHAITFSYKGDFAGQQIQVGLMTGGTDAYTYSFTVPDTAWHQVTVYLPDVTDPSLTPQLTATGAPWSTGVFDIRGLFFAPLDLSQPFGFSLDDIYLGEPASASSYAAIASSLGVGIDIVTEAYSYHFDERLTWAIIRLAAHCGCHPSAIVTMRETRSWGQIAIDLGTTWTVIQAEVDGAGLAQPVFDPDTFTRSLSNGPLPTPAPAAIRYVPSTQYLLPSLLGCP